MIRIDIISAVPSLLQGPLQYSIVGRAVDEEKVAIHIHDLRDYTEDKHLKIDDYPYGGGAGMVLTPQPIFDCIQSLCEEREYDEIIFTSPDGELFQQSDANNLSLKKNLIILCGHYKGVDQRVRDELITKEFSIGDYVLSGDRKSTRLNSSHVAISYAVFCLKKKKGNGESALNGRRRQ